MSAPAQPVFAPVRRWFGRNLPLKTEAFSLAAGLRAAVAIATPVLLGELLGMNSLSWVAIVAFWGCLADPGGAWRDRLLVLAVFNLLASLGVVVALLAAPHFLLAVVLTFAWCFVASFARVYGAAASSVGLLLMSDLLISLALPAGSLEEIGERVGLTLAGGVWSMLLVLILWRLHPHGPARAAVAGCWHAIGAYADALGRLHGSAEAAWSRIMVAHRRAIREAIEQARGVLARDRRRIAGLSRRGQEILALLTEAERSFERMVALSELLEVARPGLPADAARALLAALRRIGQEAESLARTLTESRPGRPVSADRAMKLLRHRLSGPAAAAPMIGSILALIGEIADSLTTSRAIASGVVSPQDLAAAMAVPSNPPDPVKIVQTIRDNLRLDSLHLRHALRLSITVAAGEALVSWLVLPRGYWLTMTAAVTLQPFLATTWSRTFERVAGSVLGGAIAAVLGVYITDPAKVMLLVVPLSVVTLAIRGVNYTLFVICLTPLFILIAELFQGGLGSWDLAWLRGLDSAVGGALALAAAFLLWPAREEPLLRKRLGGAVMAVRMLVGAALGGAADVEAVRRTAGLACNNLEASIQRLAAEPRNPNAHLLEPAMTTLVVCRRLGGAAAASLVLQRSGGGTPPATLANWIDGSLGALAEAIQDHRPAQLPPAPEIEADGDALAHEVVEMRRQVETLQEAAMRLASEENGAPREAA
ncbi:MAG TPA: FUSC family protein [Stellaceae bacterium]|nr:FUSC family protein [Stellaceae bacterium]